MSPRTQDYTMYDLSGVSIKPLKVTVRVDNADLDMEVDTGASMSIISELGHLQSPVTRWTTTFPTSPVQGQ